MLATNDSCSIWKTWPKTISPGSDVLSGFWRAEVNNPEKSKEFEQDIEAIHNPVLEPLAANCLKELWELKPIRSSEFTQAIFIKNFMFDAVQSNSHPVSLLALQDATKLYRQDTGNNFTEYSKFLKLAKDRQMHWLAVSDCMKEVKKTPLPGLAYKILPQEWLSKTLEEKYNFAKNLTERNRISRAFGIQHPRKSNPHLWEETIQKNRQKKNDYYQKLKEDLNELGDNWLSQALTETNYNLIDDWEWFSKTAVEKQEFIESITNKKAETVDSQESKREGEQKTEPKTPEMKSRYVGSALQHMRQKDENRV